MVYLLGRILLVFGAAWTTAVMAQEPAETPFDPAVPAAVMRPVVRVIAPPPAPVFKVQDYGAKGDGTTYDTVAIQNAIDACAGSGGSVLLEGGHFVSAQLTLRGGMTFYVAAGAELQGGLEPVDYPELMPTPPARTFASANRRSLLYAFAAHKLVIDGGGVINGRGQDVKMSGVEPLRPSLLRIFGSDDVTVRHITLRNPRMWTAVYSECRRLTIQATITDAPAYCPNLDGMDICDSEDVIIRDNTVSSEDDGICLKSHGSPGLRNILVENNTITCHRANGIKIGTATKGPITGLRILNNTITHAQYGGLCLESVDGSAMSDVLVCGLEMRQVGQPLFLRLAARNGSLPPSTGTAEVPISPTASMRGIVIERVRALASHGKTGTSTSTITGVPGLRISDVTLRDVYLEVPGGLANIPSDPKERIKDYPQSNLFGQPPASALYLRHADGIHLERVTVNIAKPDARPWLVASDGTFTTDACTPVVSAQ